MTGAAAEKLELLQRELYEKAFAEAHAFFHKVPEYFEKYTRAFEADVPEDFSRIRETEILESMQGSAIVLYGDFHTLKQSQKGLLRLLRSHVKNRAACGLVLTLEAFRATDQDAIRGYLAGSLDDEEFLAAVDYEKNWGFPWNHYRMFFEFAREHNIAIYGINGAASGRSNLQKRDQFAAQALVNIARQHGDATIVCLIGEHHLANKHLPQELRIKMVETKARRKIVRILANVDKYYFQLDLGTQAASSEHLKLGENFFCIVNCPPWIKWQSYAIWQETRGIKLPGNAGDDVDDDLEFYTENTFDLDSQFAFLVKNLAEFLRLPTSQRMESGFHLSSADHGDLTDCLRSSNLSKRAIERIMDRTTLDGFFFVPSERRILISEVTLNNLAEAAAQYLQFALTTPCATEGTTEHQFYRSVVKNAMGVLGSKILNPRRIVLDLESLQEFVIGTHRRKLAGIMKTKRNAAQQALRHHRWMVERLTQDTPAFQRPPRQIFSDDLAMSFEISRYVGQMLGAHLYARVIANRISAEAIRALFRTSIADWPANWKLVCRMFRLAGF